MKILSARLVAFSSLVLVTAACTQSAPPPPAAAPPIAEATPAAPPVDTKALAAKLVKSAAIKEGDIVGISGGLKDWQLLEDLSVEVRKAGAFPLTTAGSDDLSRRMVTDVPEKYDSQKPALDLKITEMVDAFIALDYIERDDLLAGVPASRLAARAAAAAPVGELAFKRNLRQVNLGNGLLPTAAAATRFGVPQDQLTKMYLVGRQHRLRQAAGDGDRRERCSCRRQDRAHHQPEWHRRDGEHRRTPCLPERRRHFSGRHETWRRRRGGVPARG